MTFQEWYTQEYVIAQGAPASGPFMDDMERAFKAGIASKDDGRDSISDRPHQEFATGD